jgi:hypothetical protein
MREFRDNPQYHDAGHAPTDHIRAFLSCPLTARQRADRRREARFTPRARLSNAERIFSGLNQMASHVTLKN